MASSFTSCCRSPEPVTERPSTAAGAFAQRGHPPGRRCQKMSALAGSLAAEAGRSGVAYTGDGLETALAATELAAQGALKMAGSTTRELKKAKAAAASGVVRDLRRALEAAETAARALAELAAELRAGYDVDESGHLASGSFAKELLAAADDAGVAMFKEDDRLLCYPSLVRVLPAELAVEVDRRRDRRLRPSVLVASLAQAQGAAPRFKPEPFFESLKSAYELVLARQRKAPGAVVRLVDVHAVLTLLPGSARDYSRQEFARDLYLLDQSGLTTSDRSGARLRWSASTGTKGAGVLTTVSRVGQQQRYWGIAFTGGGGES